MEKRLYRSQSERMIAGVCGGLGEYLAVDPVWLRLGFVILLFSGSFGFWAYVILWIIIPRQDQQAIPPSEIVQASVQEMTDRARELGTSVQRSFQGNRTPSETGPTSGPFIVGITFILLGTLLLLNKLNLLQWLSWGTWWPTALIVIGCAMLISRLRRY